MTWTRYLMHDFWTAREFERIDDARRTAARAERRRLRRDRQDAVAQAERIAALEQDLGEVALLARTLAELCLTKGILGADELAATAERLDAADGIVDGRSTRPAAPGNGADDDRSGGA